MQSHSDACFYVADAPLIEVRDGMFHVTYTHGAWRFHVTMPPRVFFRALRLANDVAGEFEDHPGATVVRFPRDDGDSSEDGVAGRHG